MIDIPRSSEDAGCRGILVYSDNSCWIHGYWPRSSWRTPRTASTSRSTRQARPRARPRSSYGFRYGDKFYFYQSGFDPGYARQSVGLVALGLTIKAALEEGAMEYDLLHGDEEYKFLWAHQTRELRRLELFPSYVRGWL